MRDTSSRLHVDGSSVGGKITVYTLLILLSAFFIFPFLWMITTSLKLLGDVYLMPPKLISWPIQWINYVNIFTQQPLLQYLWNTVVYVVFCMIGTSISSSMVAFAFARLRARGKNVLFAIVLGTLLLPSQVTMIPQYLLFKDFGWLNTYLPLIVPAFAGSAFNIFLLRQFFRGLPQELDEAVTIDGGGFFTIYFRIILPLSIPVLATVAILELMYRWNDLIGPLIYLNNTNLYPISLGLANFSAAYGGTPWNLLMAASFVSVIPLLIIFFVAQKWLIRGIVISGSKG